MKKQRQLRLEISPPALADVPEEAVLQAVHLLAELLLVVANAKEEIIRTTEDASNEH